MNSLKSRPFKSKGVLGAGKPTDIEEYFGFCAPARCIQVVADVVSQKASCFVLFDQGGDALAPSVIDRKVFKHCAVYGSFFHGYKLIGMYMVCGADRKQKRCDEPSHGQFILPKIVFFAFSKADRKQFVLRCRNGGFCGVQLLKQIARNLEAPEMSQVAS
ncbi:hypothetical protein [Shimia sp.]|uniref:hypothetical protein n=1 Tax=Shimia sp. TaxID=1954381 RepID=UPI003BAC6955